MSRLAWIVSLVASILPAQRVFEKANLVIFEDAQKRQINLGTGFNPVMTADGKNSVVVFDPVTEQQKTIFDRAIEFDRGSLSFCIFEQMQVSVDSLTLYLVSPVYATSGSLAIVDLLSGSIKYVPGVDSVYVIQSGPHRDELIYQRRVYHKTNDGGEYPHYPFIHARHDGEQIAEISDEFFTVGGHDKLPILRAYLRKIRATIVVNGDVIP